MRDVLIRRMTTRRWHLNAHALYEGEEHVIEWDSLFPEELGTKNQRDLARRSTKLLLLAMIDAPRPVRGTVVSSSTVLNWFGLCRRLLRWMIERDLWRYSQLTADHLVEYLSEIRLSRSARRFDGYKSHRAHIRLVQQMWDLRTQYPSALRVNPGSLDLASSVQTSSPARWKPLPDEVALPLIRAAWSWLKDNAPYVLNAADRVWRNGPHTPADSRALHRLKSRVADELVEDETFRRIRHQLNLDGSPARTLDGAILATEGACVVLLLFLVGIRIRELARLDIGCLVENLGSTGEIVFALRGIAAKSDGTERTWAVTDPVRLAVETLEQMHSAARTLEKRLALVLQPAKGRPPLAPHREARRATTATLTHRLTSFAKVALPADLVAGVNIHPHAARKTFARFVVLRDKRALEALAHHYGHAHRAITDGYYVGSDIELSRLLDEESRRDLADGLSDLLSRSNVGGKAGRLVEKMKAAAGSKFLGKRALSALVDRLIADGVKLAPCDWGYCVYSKALSACHGNADGPNEIERSPEVCSGCSNFAVTPRHIAWWQERFVRDERFLNDVALPLQTRQVVEQRLASTEQILKGLVLQRMSPGELCDEAEQEQGR